MWLTNVIRVISYRPMQAVETLLLVSLALGGLYLVTPFYTPETNATAGITQNTSIPQILGAFHIGLALWWGDSLFRRGLRGMGSRRNSALMMTSLYIFYGIAQTVIFGFERIPWLATFTLAALAGVVYLWLALGDDGN